MMKIFRLLKRYETWKRRARTKEFLSILEEDLKNEDQNCSNPLIKVDRVGLNENRATWVHPKVAINIAEWYEITDGKCYW